MQTQSTYDTESIYQILEKHSNLIIGKDKCPCCEKAKKFLESKKIEYKYLDHNECKEFAQTIKNTKKHYTFPQVFLNKHFIGGYSDLKRTYKNYKLFSGNYIK